MDALSACAQLLWMAIQTYNGNENRVKQLARLVKNTVDLAHSANLGSFPEADNVIESLTDYIRQGISLMEELESTASLWRPLKVLTQGDRINDITNGMQDSLESLNLLNVHLSQQHQKSLDMLRGEFEAYSGNLQQTNGELAKLRVSMQELGQLQVASIQRQDKLMEVAQTYFELAPQELAGEELQLACGQGSGGAGAAVSSNELQVSRWWLEGPGRAGSESPAMNGSCIIIVARDALEVSIAALSPCGPAIYMAQVALHAVLALGTLHIEARQTGVELSTTWVHPTHVT
jgi:hypothetical protein